MLAPIQTQCAQAEGEVSGETVWQGLRLVWAHDPERAAEQTTSRQARIDEIVASAQARAGKLDQQDAGEVFRGRRLSDSGAKAWMLREVSDANLGAIIKVDLTSEAFRFDIDEQALERARLNDGKLLLVTNVADLKPDEVIERYKSLADIERGFRVLKSDIEIAPVFHRLPERIKAHALICFLALGCTGCCACSSRTPTARTRRSACCRSHSASSSIRSPCRARGRLAASANSTPYSARSSRR